MINLDALRKRFPTSLQENVVMANYTTSRVGGAVDALLPINTLDEMTAAAQLLWDLNIPFHLIGSGSNILVSDEGLPGVILLNRMKNVKIDSHPDQMTVWAESGANLSHTARQVALRGLSDLEWAATIPGSVGGATYGNAGAFGSNIQSHFVMADILHRDSGIQTWNARQMAYQYRSSILKREHQPVVILATRFQLAAGTSTEAEAKIEEYQSKRRQTQPTGACMGSTFKNPEGDYAGRLIEAAGLKGHRLGGVEISPVHANFFINTGRASAHDYWQLINLTKKKVADAFGVNLELEIELLGQFPAFG